MKRSGAVRVDGAVPVSQAIEHHLGVVVELEAQPVPSSFVGIDGFGEEFVVHPRRALDLVWSR